MNAIVIARQGTPVAPNVEHVRDYPDPKPRHGEVLVSTEAAALNHLDLWVGMGLPGIELTYPRISGSDGCGRVIEGTMPMMWGSLEKLLALPDDTTVYVGHEYTQANARFALTIDPSNPDLVARSGEVDALRAGNKSTLPTTIGLEKRTNPFLRVDSPAVRERLGMPAASAADVFGEIRTRKDNF